MYSDLRIIRSLARREKIIGIVDRDADSLNPLTWNPPESKGSKISARWKMAPI